MDSFQTASGLAGPLTLEIEGPGLPAAERRSFAQPFALIGRDDRADLMLDHDMVSRRHAYLQVIDGRVFVVDLESRAGTIGGEGPVESGWISPGQTLLIGPYSVRLASSATDSDSDSAEGGSGGEEGGGFEFSAAASAPPANPLLARSSKTDDLPRISLEFQSRTAGHSVWRMKQVLAMVGSSPRCKVRLLDSNVSKLHCALLRTSSGLFVVDLLGRGGIMVNGVPVKSARLGARDVLGLGQVIVRPYLEGESAKGTAPGSRGSAGAGQGGQPAPNLPARPWGQGPLPALGTGPPAHFTPVRPPDGFATDRPPPGSELAANEPALALLLNHFGSMQQQMLDQFQQSMMMMMQMFGGMHRDQMGLVREELDRLRELTDEMAKIKAEMAARTRKPLPQLAPWPPPGPAAAPTPPQASPQPPSQPQPQRAAATTNGPAPPPPPFTQRPARPHDDAPPPIPKAPLEPRNPEIHDWLNERLAAITEEQQSRLQKIMGLLKGNKSG
jgi:pSer/pThr/pTyr-binding forkhead associated (FHA) protein